MSIMHTYILQFGLNTFLMNKVVECCLPSRALRQYLASFSMKKVHTILNKIWL